jgi:Domain of unknown function (DUF4913)
MEISPEELQAILVAALTAANPPPAPPEEAPPRVYHSSNAFFTDYLSIVFARDLGRDNVHWCEEWASHPEAAEVVDALWRSWETLQRDAGTGLGVWFVNFSYPMMSQLFDPSGTFASCAEGACNAPPPLSEV